MVKEQTEESIENFYFYLWQLHGESIDREYLSSLAPLLVSRSLITEIIDGLNFSSLDPAIPSFFTQCTKWGEKFNSDFNVLHDDSKPIFQEKELLESLMTREVEYEEVGFDRRKFTFPLRATGIDFGDSKHDPRLQVVDIVASCSAAWATGLVNPNKQDDFWKEITNKLDLKSFATDAVFPSTDVDPIALGTAYNGGKNAIDHMTEKLSNSQQIAPKLNGYFVACAIASAYHRIAVEFRSTELGVRQLIAA